MPEDLTLRLIADTKTQPGALPYLQFVLRLLWEQRDKNTNSLTTAAYDKMKGLKGAIGRHAQAYCDGLKLAKDRALVESMRWLGLFEQHPRVS